MKLFKAGDTLFARRNAYLKRVSMADFDGICSGDLIVLQNAEYYLLCNGTRLVKVNVQEVLSAVESEAQRKETGGTVTNIYIGGDVNGSNIISGNNTVVTQGIQNSFNKAEAADIQDELKNTLKQLCDNKYCHPGNGAISNLQRNSSPNSHRSSAHPCR